MSNSNGVRGAIEHLAAFGIYPPWFNTLIEGGHQPVWPETYERMPPEIRRLCPPRRARTRAELYERP